MDELNLIISLSSIFGPWLIFYLCSLFSTLHVCKKCSAYPPAKWFVGYFFYFFYRHMSFIGSITSLTLYLVFGMPTYLLAIMIVCLVGLFSTMIFACVRSCVNPHNPVLCAYRIVTQNVQTTREATLAELLHSVAAPVHASLHMAAYRMETRTQHYTDSNGHRRTRTVREKVCKYRATRVITNEITSWEDRSEPFPPPPASTVLQFSISSSISRSASLQSRFNDLEAQAHVFLHRYGPITEVSTSVSTRVPEVVVLWSFDNSPQGVCATRWHRRPGWFWIFDILGWGQTRDAWAAAVRTVVDWQLVKYASHGQELRCGPLQRDAQAQQAMAGKLQLPDYHPPETFDQDDSDDSDYPLPQLGEDIFIPVPSGVQVSQPCPPPMEPCPPPMEAPTLYTGVHQEYYKDNGNQPCGNEEWV